MSHYRSQIGLLAATFLTALSVPPALAQASEAGFTTEAAFALRPGQFLWAETGEAGPVRIVISIPFQRVYVFRGDRLIGLSPVSTGAPGYDTPVGQFTILQKNANHRSNLYDDAPMPFMMRLTWGGIAIHAGRNPGYPDSHGCVRVPIAFARKLFGITELGAEVVVTDELVDPLAGEMPIEAFPSPALPAEAAAIAIALQSESPPAPGGIPGLSSGARWSTSGDPAH